MPFIIILSFLVCLALCFLLYVERNARRNKMRRTLKYAHVYVYARVDDLSKKDKTDLTYGNTDFEYHPIYPDYVKCRSYPIVSGQYTIGRKERFKKKNLDIWGPERDFYMSSDAAILYLDKGYFYLKRRNQSRVWVKEGKKGTLYLMQKNADPAAPAPAIPAIWSGDYMDAADYKVHRDDYIYVGFGDSILLGNTLLEFVSNASKEDV